MRKQRGFFLKAVIFFAGIPVLLLNWSCSTSQCEQTYEDGTYRGIFADGPDIQVNVEFTLKDGVVTEASFRHLRRDENYNIDAEADPYKSVVAMYRESLDYLVGKNLQEHLRDLYTPEDIVTVEVDGYSSATIRSAKIISAIRDGLNRGVYSY